MDSEVVELFVIMTEERPLGPKTLVNVALEEGLKMKTWSKVSREHHTNGRRPLKKKNQIQILLPLLSLGLLIPQLSNAQLRCEDVLRNSRITGESAQIAPSLTTPSASAENLTEAPSKPAATKNAAGEFVISPDAEFYANQVVDSKKFRPPEIVSQNAKTITIKNFLHENKFYEVEVDLDSIDQVYIQALPFDVLPGVRAGHIQARFTFKTDKLPRLLKVLNANNEWVDTNPTEVTPIKDLVVSYEAALPKGASYNFLIGAVDANPLVGRIVSGEQKHSEGPERQVIQYRIPLNAVERSTLLSRYFNHAASIQMNLYYNTVTQNCTTTIFDALDSLPRFQRMIQQNQLRPFLTNIGGDPVIGPARIALLARFGSTLVQVQELNQERAGIFSESPVDLAQQTRHRFAFAPGGENPMSLLVVMDDVSHLTPDQQAKLRAIRDEIRTSLPETFNILIAAGSSVGQNLGSGSEILKTMMKIISKRFRDRLANHSFQLPEQPVQIKLLFAPYPSTQNTTPLTQRGLRAELPFPVQDIELTLQNREAFFHSIQTGLDEVEARADKSIPAFMKASSVNFVLSQSRSVVESQFVFGLQPLEQSQNIQNDQLHIQRLNIPQAPEQSRWRNFLSRFQRSERQVQSQLVTMLMQHEQAIFSDQIEDTLRAQFGHNPLYISQQRGQSSFILRAETQNNYLCFAGLYPHGPRLSGQLSSAPLGSDSWWRRLLNRVLGQRPVSLTITHLDLNLNRLEIESIRIRVGTLGFRCLEMRSVNEQFRGEANTMLQDLIQRLGQTPIPLSTLRN